MASAYPPKGFVKPEFMSLAVRQAPQGASAEQILKRAREMQSQAEASVRTPRPADHPAPGQR